MSDLKKAVAAAREAHSEYIANPHVRGCADACAYALCENCEESAYVIDKLAKLLAEIAVIVNGPEPPLTSWSYHDLPEKVRALKEAQQPAAAVPDGYALVPVEPTQEMLDAAGMSIVPAGKEWLDQSNRETWAAMLAAANKENNNG